MRHLLISASVLLLVAADLGCSAGRGYGEPCAATADCLDSLACVEGECIRPGDCPSKAPVDCGDGTGCCPSSHPACCGDGKCYPTAAECRAATCASSGESCRASTDCCSGLTCQSGRCGPRTPLPRCGNGRCESGESQASCCSDCGCPLGQSCQAGQCRAPSPVLNWTVVNQCFNGEDIQFRFFAKARSVVWPGGDRVYVSKPGSTVVQPLTCVFGEQICFGANQPIHGLTWDVGIDGTDGCTDCCFLCANGSVGLGPLVCP